MTKSDFNLIWFDELALSEEDLKIDRLAQQYVKEAEEYDRTICTGPIIKNSIMPANYKEVYLSSAYARKLFKKLVTENQICSKKLLKAIQRIQ